MQYDKEDRPDKSTLIRDPLPTLQNVSTIKKGLEQVCVDKQGGLGVWLFIHGIRTLFPDCVLNMTAYEIINRDIEKNINERVTYKYMTRVPY